MFFGSSHYLLLVKKNKLELIFNKTSKELVYPPNLVQNLEVSDSTNFEKAVNQFLNEADLKKEKFLIVLSEELLFSKTFPNVSVEQVNEQVESFVSSVPFAPPKVSYKKVLKSSELTLISTNKDFYVSIKKAIEDLGHEVLAVVPITAFKDKLGFDEDSIDSNSAKKILGAGSLIKASDFLSDSDGQINESIFHKTFSPLYLVILGVLIVGAVAILGGVSFGLIPNPINLITGEKVVDSDPEMKEVVDSTPTPEATESAQEEASSSAKSKEEITAQVLNGSGISGQAGRVKGVLEDLGYEDIEVGNAEGEDRTETEVVFSNNIAKTEQDELLEALDDLLGTINAEEASDEAEFDIVITTGSYEEE